MLPNPLQYTRGRHRYRSSNDVPMMMSQFGGGGGDPSNFMMQPQMAPQSMQMMWTGQQGGLPPGRPSRSADPSPSRHYPQPLHQAPQSSNSGFQMQPYWSEPNKTPRTSVRSADPSPSRTAFPPFPQPVSYWPRNTHNVVDFSQGDFDRQQVGVETDWNPTPLPIHHTHQVMYVCHGQCTGPQCDFSRRSKQWHSMTYLDGSGQDYY